MTQKTIDDDAIARLEKRHSITCSRDGCDGEDHSSSVTTDAEVDELDELESTYSKDEEATGLGEKYNKHTEQR